MIDTMRAEPYGRFKPLPIEAATLLEEGQIIDAVKSLRASNNLGLKEAKDWIDQHIASEPLLRVKLETRQKAARRKLFYIFLVFDVFIAAGLIYYFVYMPR
jgi:hypothetical protein